MATDRGHFADGADFLTVEEVAARSGYAEKTVYRAIGAGRLRASRPATRWRIALEDYWMWMRCEPTEVGIGDLTSSMTLAAPALPPGRGSREALRALAGNGQ